MVAGRTQTLTRTNCPSCNAILRIQAQLPNGTPVRCAGCRASFRYRAGNQAAKPAIPRKKELSCPGCAMQFMAALGDENKIECPNCHGRICIRRSRKTQLEPAAGSAPRPASPDSSAHKRTKLESGRPAKKTKLATAASAPKPPANNGGWIPGPVAPMEAPLAARPRPGQDQVSTRSIVIAVTLLLIVGAVPLWFLLFADAKRETVRGTVTFGGKPLVTGSVTLQGEDGNLLSGFIKSDGSYSVAGVPHGKVLIGVRGTVQRQLRGEAADEPADGEDEDNQFISLPDHFGSVNRSGLSVVVTGETTHNIELQ